MKHIRLATPCDDESLRNLVADTPMEGRVRLKFLREPSFFQAESIGNKWFETIVLEENGEVLGLGTRAGRRILSSGEDIELGYLGMLRASLNVRNSIFLARCYKFLKQLHEDSPHRVPYYLTAILSENKVARQILESGRAGLPSYTPIADYCTYVVGRIPNKWRRNNVKIRVSKSSSDLQDLFESSRNWSRGFSFASSYSLDDLKWLDFIEWQIVEVRSDSASAKALLCDMSKVRQTLVDAYPASMRMLPYMNWVLGCLGYPRIPHCGERLGLLYPCALSLKGDEEDALIVLMSAIREQKEYEDKFLAVGFDKRFLPGVVLKDGSISTTESIVYKVAWNDNTSSIQSNSDKPVHLDVGTL